MTKAEFVDQVAAKTGLTKAAAGDAVNKMLETIEDALAGGDEVAFTGFGKFSVQSRAARTGVNPRTGEKVKIAAAKVPKFTAGAALKEKVKTGKKAAPKKK